ncbi:MAG: hypothetical protein ABIK48_01730 [candidate division WOR-3 bacterium]
MSFYSTLLYSTLLYSTLLYSLLLQYLNPSGEVRAGRRCCWWQSAASGWKSAGNLIDLNH